MHGINIFGGFWWAIARKFEPANWPVLEKVKAHREVSEADSQLDEYSILGNKSADWHAGQAAASHNVGESRAEEHIASQQIYESLLKGVGQLLDLWPSREDPYGALERPTRDRKARAFVDVLQPV